MVVTDFCKKLATTNLIPLRWFPYIWWPVFTPGGEGWGGYLLSGGDFISLAAIADAEKAIANGNRNNGKNMRFIIILPVN